MVSYLSVVCQIIIIFIFLEFGVFAVKDFQCNEFLLEYSGELISVLEGQAREDQYDPSLGSYIFFYEKYW